MAPTICDDLEPYGNRNTNRLRQHCSVINYVGRQTNRTDEVASSDEKSSVKFGRIRVKRFRCDNRFSSDSDDSSDGFPGPMVFHNYAKRRRFSDPIDENCISPSSDSSEQFVSSTISPFSESFDRENMPLHSIIHPSPRYPFPLTPYSPVSSTTDAMALCHRWSKTSPRYTNPFYRYDLMDIAMKTIILLQRNRSLHARLHQLKLETRAFVSSVMSNPENAKLRQTINQSNDKSIDLTSSSNILSIKNQ